MVFGGVCHVRQLITVVYEWALVLNIHGQIDVTFLDFAKTFDSVPHEQLLLKADYHWIANIWLWSFPTERTASGRVVSRLPQGTVLGPILFLKLINDLPTKITSSIKLFADDCVPYRPINSAGDQFALSCDLDQLEKWAWTWQMKFAPTKCFVMSVILNNSRFQFSYALCNVQLAIKNTSASMYVKLAVAVWRSKKEGYKSLYGSFKGISHRAVDLLRNAHTHP